METTVVTKSTPVVMLTVGQLAEYISGQHLNNGKDQAPNCKNIGGVAPGKYVYGLRGIRNRYGVGANTACAWASGLLAPAVIRDGRKIILNTEKADQILEEWTQEQRKKQVSK